jgi:hypothetical protein
VTAQVFPEAPLHAPPQLPKTKPAAGTAVRVTLLPVANAALQVPPQLIPAGALVTVPFPVLVTVRTAVEGAALNVAATFRLAFIVTAQVVPDVPLHAPPQPANVAAPVGVAVKVTTVP